MMLLIIPQRDDVMNGPVVPTYAAAAVTVVEDGNGSATPLQSTPLTPSSEKKTHLLGVKRNGSIEI